MSRQTSLTLTHSESTSNINDNFVLGHSKSRNVNQNQEPDKVQLLQSMVHRITEKSFGRNMFYSGLRSRHGRIISSGSIAIGDSKTGPNFLVELKTNVPSSPSNGKSNSHRTVAPSSERRKIKISGNSKGRRSASSTSSASTNSSRATSQASSLHQHQSKAERHSSSSSRLVNAPVISPLHDGDDNATPKGKQSRKKSKIKNGVLDGADNTGVSTPVDSFDGGTSRGQSPSVAKFKKPKKAVTAAIKQSVTSMQYEDNSVSEDEDFINRYGSVSSSVVVRRGTAQQPSSTRRSPEPRQSGKKSRHRGDDRDLNSPAAHSGSSRGGSRNRVVMSKVGKDNKDVDYRTQQPPPQLPARTTSKRRYDDQSDDSRKSTEEATKESLKIKTASYNNAADVLERRRRRFAEAKKTSGIVSVKELPTLESEAARRAKATAAPLPASKSSHGQGATGGSTQLPRSRSPSSSSSGSSSSGSSSSRSRSRTSAQSMECSSPERSPRRVAPSRGYKDKDERIHSHAIGIPLPGDGSKRRKASSTQHDSLIDIPLPPAGIPEKTAAPAAGGVNTSIPPPPPPRIGGPIPTIPPTHYPGTPHTPFVGGMPPPLPPHGGVVVSPSSGRKSLLATPTSMPPPGYPGGPPPSMQMPPPGQNFGPPPPPPPHHDGNSAATPVKLRRPSASTWVQPPPDHFETPRDTNNGPSRPPVDGAAYTDPTADGSMRRRRGDRQKPLLAAPPPPQVSAHNRGHDEPAYSTGVGETKPTPGGSDMDLRRQTLAKDVDLREYLANRRTGAPGPPRPPAPPQEEPKGRRRRSGFDVAPGEAYHRGESQEDDDDGEDYNYDRIKEKMEKKQQHQQDQEYEEGELEHKRPNRRRDLSRDTGYGYDTEQSRYESRDTDRKRRYDDEDYYRSSKHGRYDENRYYDEYDSQRPPDYPDANGYRQRHGGSGPGAHSRVSGHHHGHSQYDEYGEGEYEDEGGDRAAGRPSRAVERKPRSYHDSSFEESSMGPPKVPRLTRRRGVPSEDMGGGYGGEQQENMSRGLHGQVKRARRDGGEEPGRYSGSRVLEMDKVGAASEGTTPLIPPVGRRQQQQTYGNSIPSLVTNRRDSSGSFGNMASEFGSTDSVFTRLSTGGGSTNNLTRMPRMNNASMVAPAPEPEQSVTGDQYFTFFFTKKYPFSNHYPCNLEIDNNKFSCTEQFYMFMKAMMFDDTDSARNILACNDAKRIKTMGSAVVNFEKSKWDEHSYKVMELASKCKYEQNVNLRKELFMTANTTLVECNPSDQRWGIAIGLDDPRRFDKKLWRGKNLLGVILTELREQMMKDPKYKTEIETALKERDMRYNRRLTI